MSYLIQPPTDPELIVFDLDGVLVDTSGCHARAYSDLWDRIGIEGPRYEEIAGQKTRDVIAAKTSALVRNGVRLAEWIEFKQNRARQYLRSEPIVFDDTIFTLAHLRATGRRIALGTAASRETTNEVLERLDFTSGFELVITAEDVNAGKPDPSVYLSLIAQARVEAERTMVVEDSKSGIAAALTAGAWTVSVRSGLARSHPRFAGSFSNLSDWLRWLESTDP